MGKSFTICCEKCGTQFMHFSDETYGMLQACVGCGDGYSCSIEQPKPIFCPGCRSRINPSPEVFNRQVESITLWE